ncbi:DUF2145 domain-containing protein [Pluralibacter gergoviae]|uniref:DUF2145 domain-containing protein n=1 Tax=Pluralibacter gergoviae TaxID=61647 RepID=A0AAW8HLX4_PLUGE|nr:DUF2145 domain-containing protein [Pluralibacter gergoviae]AVR03220.1 DUF2145 domain-containing protein [Pluralibacter gergoviae]EKT9642874.1 DUF2145 domain-containing protein [Pluralibacter gergoviae]EKV3545885.1 DUF2145 domain-containing protein [Pluralibacter gergoviae]EKV9901228.1 DUF2145 domain-containing protein [Pluralibacter gergoviae]EKV9932883.1 DUF2145 domain-containing protein [Pluralibacter gergoviae]
MMRRLLLLCLSLIALDSSANSGNCACRTQAPETVSAIMHRAALLRQSLDSEPDPVVILARQGQDMSDRHLIWSHTGYAMRQANGDWWVYHNLNLCGTDRSELFVQGLYEFLDDELVNPNIAILRPAPAQSAALAELLTSPIKLNLFHSPRYNMIAWPFDGPYQNSNGWLLEVFARASDREIWSRKAARSWLQAQHYQPSIVRASTFERVGAKLFTRNIFTDDQPASLLKQGKIALNSGDSTIRFLAAYSRPVAGCDHQGWGQSVCIFQPPTKSGQKKAAE